MTRMHFRRRAAALVGVVALLCAVLAWPSASGAVPAPRPVDPALELGEQISPSLWVRSLADGVWLFTAFDDPDSESPIPANGLVVRTNAGMVLIDTGWNADQADLLVKWCDREQSEPVRAAIVTHFHVDRAGGARRLIQQGVRLEMLESTAAKLGFEDDPMVERFTHQDTLRVGGRSIELLWPGAGHTPDNITAWIPDAQVLFGGCFVKDRFAKTLGNIDDADRTAWPSSLKRLQKRYPNAMIVVPGHGKPGGLELLEHTQGLLKAKRR